MSSAWVGVKCHHRCGSCMQLSPLNHLDFDGQVECLRCGASEDFDLGQWVDALEHARKVASGALSPKPGETYVLHGSDEHRPHAIRKRTLVTRAMPGCPTCPGCGEPLRVDRCAVGLLVVGCTGCDWSAKFLLPRGIRQSEPRLGGAIAAAHAKDARDATLETNASGAAVVHCPHCSAPLEHDVNATIARCAYCRVTVRIPASELRRRGHELEPELWWLYFVDAGS